MSKPTTTVTMTMTTTTHPATTTATTTASPAFLAERYLAAIRSSTTNSYASKIRPKPSNILHTGIATAKTDNSNTINSNSGNGLTKQQRSTSSSSLRLSAVQVQVQAGLQVTSVKAGADSPTPSTSPSSSSTGTCTCTSSLQENIPTNQHQHMNQHMNQHINQHMNHNHYNPMGMNMNLDTDMEEMLQSRNGSTSPSRGRLRLSRSDSYQTRDSASYGQEQEKSQQQQSHQHQHQHQHPSQLQQVLQQSDEEEDLVNWYPDADVDADAHDDDAHDDDNEGTRRKWTQIQWRNFRITQQEEEYNLKSNQRHSQNQKSRLQMNNHNNNNVVDYDVDKDETTSDVNNTPTEVITNKANKAFDLGRNLGQKWLVNSRNANAAVAKSTAISTATDSNIPNTEKEHGKVVEEEACWNTKPFASFKHPSTQQHQQRKTSLSPTFNTLEGKNFFLVKEQQQQQHQLQPPQSSPIRTSSFASPKSKTKISRPFQQPKKKTFQKNDRGWIKNNNRSDIEEHQHQQQQQQEQQQQHHQVEEAPPFVQPQEQQHSNEQVCKNKQSLMEEVGNKPSITATIAAIPSTSTTIAATTTTTTPTSSSKVSHDRKWIKKVNIHPEQEWNPPSSSSSIENLQPDDGVICTPTISRSLSRMYPERPKKPNHKTSKIKIKDVGDVSANARAMNGNDAGIGITGTGSVEKPWKKKRSNIAEEGGVKNITSTMIQQQQDHEIVENDCNDVNCDIQPNLPQHQMISDDPKHDTGANVDADANDGADVVEYHEKSENKNFLAGVKLRRVVKVGDTRKVGIPQQQQQQQQQQQSFQYQQYEDQKNDVTGGREDNVKRQKQQKNDDNIFVNAGAGVQVDNVESTKHLFKLRPIADGNAISDRIKRLSGKFQHDEEQVHVSNLTPSTPVAATEEKKVSIEEEVEDHETVEVVEAAGIVSLKEKNVVRRIRELSGNIQDRSPKRSPKRSPNRLVVSSASKVSKQQRGVNLLPTVGQKILNEQQPRNGPSWKRKTLSIKALKSQYTDHVTTTATSTTPKSMPPPMTVTIKPLKSQYTDNVTTTATSTTPKSMPPPMTVTSKTLKSQYTDYVTTSAARTTPKSMPALITSPTGQVADNFVAMRSRLRSWDGKARNESRKSSTQGEKQSLRLSSDVNPEIEPSMTAFPLQVDVAAKFGELETKKAMLKNHDNNDLRQSHSPHPKQTENQNSENEQKLNINLPKTSQIRKNKSSNFLFESAAVSKRKNELEEVLSLRARTPTNITTKKWVPNRGVDTTLSQNIEPRFSPSPIRNNETKQTNDYVDFKDNKDTLENQNSNKAQALNCPKPSQIKRNKLNNFLFESGPSRSPKRKLKLEQVSSIRAKTPSSNVSFQKKWEPKNKGYSITRPQSVKTKGFVPIGSSQVKDALDHHTNQAEEHEHDHDSVKKPTDISNEFTSIKERIELLTVDLPTGLAQNNVQDRKKPKTQVASSSQREKSISPVPDESSVDTKGRSVISKGNLGVSRLPGTSSNPRWSPTAENHLNVHGLKPFNESVNSMNANEDIACDANNYVANKGVKGIKSMFEARATSPTFSQNKVTYSHGKKERADTKKKNDLILNRELLDEAEPSQVYGKDDSKMERLDQLSAVTRDHNERNNAYQGTEQGDFVKTKACVKIESNTVLVHSNDVRSQLCYANDEEQVKKTIHRDGAIKVKMNVNAVAGKEIVNKSKPVESAVVQKEGKTKTQLVGNTCFVRDRSGNGEFKFGNLRSMFESVSTNTRQLHTPTTGIEKCLEEELFSPPKIDRSVTNAASISTMDNEKLSEVTSGFVSIERCENDMNIPSSERNMTPCSDLDEVDRSYSANEFSDNKNVVQEVFLSTNNGNVNQQTDQTLHYCDVRDNRDISSPQNDIPWKEREENDIPWSSQDRYESWGGSLVDQKAHIDMTNNGNVASDPCYEDEDCDGVTLSPTISDVSSLSIPSGLHSIEPSDFDSSSEDTGAMESGTMESGTISGTDKQSSATKGASEASSSHTSEAATPLIHSTLRTMTMNMRRALATSYSDSTQSMDVAHITGLLGAIPPLAEDEEDLLLQHSQQPSSLTANIDHCTDNDFVPEWQADFFTNDSIRSIDDDEWAPFPSLNEEPIAFTEQQPVSQPKANDTISRNQTIQAGDDESDVMSSNISSSAASSTHALTSSSRVYMLRKGIQTQNIPNTTLDKSTLLSQSRRSATRIEKNGMLTSSIIRTNKIDRDGNEVHNIQESTSNDRENSDPTVTSKQIYKSNTNWRRTSSSRKFDMQKVKAYQMARRKSYDRQQNLCNKKDSKS